MARPRKNPDRPAYVAVPRDLDTQATFTALSRDAQWLLQHIERDSYRLKCGVFAYNPRMIARSAKSTEDDVDLWMAELVSHGWIIEDADAGEAWLTQHMTWDYTLIAENNAKSVLADVKRVRSERLARSIREMVYAKFPALRIDDADPGWIEPEGVEMTGDDTQEYGDTHPVPDGVQDTVAHSPSLTTPPSHTPIANSTKHHPRSTEPEANSPSTKHEAPGGAQCEKCDDLGITATNGSPGPCTCAAGRATTRALKVVS